MRQFSLIFTILFFLFGNNLFAVETNLENKPVCEASRGNWRLFTNSCADNCSSKFDIEVCTRDNFYSCDCGEKRCFDGTKCVKEKDVAQEWEEKLSKRKEKLAEEAKTQKLITIYNVEEEERKKREEQKKQEKPKTGIPVPPILQSSSEQEIKKRKDKENDRAEKTTYCATRGAFLREFNNGCADNCSSKVTSRSICTQVMTLACDCGSSRCWDNSSESCILISEFKKQVGLQNQNNNNDGQELTLPVFELPTKSQ